MSNPIQLELFEDSFEDKGKVLESLFAKLSVDHRNRFDEALQVAWETTFHRRDRFVLEKLRDVSSRNDYENLRKNCIHSRFRGWLEILIILSSEATSLQQFCEHRQRSWEKQDQMRRNLYYPAFLLFFTLVAFLSVSVVASKLFEFSKTLQVDASYGGSSATDFDSIAVVSAIVPAVIGIALGAMVLIRCLGGAVAWSFVGGSLPGIGGVWRWMATAELMRWTGLLGHSKSLPECMEILACITEYPVNRAIAVRVKWGLEDGLDFGRAIAQPVGVHFGQVPY